MLSVTEALRSAIFSSHSAALLIIKSFCPPSHRWASLDLHSTGLSRTSQVGPSGCLVEARYLKHTNWSLGYLRARFLDRSSSPYTLLHWDPPFRQWSSFIKCSAETILNLIISQLCVRVIHRMNVRTHVSFRCEIYGSWTYTQLNGFSSLPSKRLLINVINM